MAMYKYIYILFMNIKFAMLRYSLKHSLKILLHTKSKRTHAWNECVPKTVSVETERGEGPRMPGVVPLKISWR